MEVSQWPPLENGYQNPAFAPQTPGISFTGATLSDAGAFPPDVMGAVGPTQYVVFVNGRLRTFDKSIGVADGILDADPDVFFSLVTTPPGTGEVTYTSDPNVRYDRLSGRWFLTIIDVTLNTTSGAITQPNRNLFAWSDGPTISGSTMWTFTYYQNTTYFDDYPSLGIDADAIYVGTNQFSVAGSLNNMTAYVWNKSSFLSGSPTGFIFPLYVGGSTAQFSPRGVDNYDPNNTGPTAVGYFIGVDVFSYGLLILNRVTNPAGSPPTMSTNISLTVATTSNPITVRHLGNTIPGSNGYLDALDDRLFAAHLRNGSLWTAHNIGVRGDGVASTNNANRDAVRWYEITNLDSTPSIIQTGTLYDNSGNVNNSNQRSYWIPSIMVSGQGHAALGCSIAGTNEHINCFTTGRLSGDALGTMRDGPGGSTLPGYTSSTTAYNPASDPGGTSGRRWGDYSFTSLDPNDDMTMWTAQEFCDAANSWGVRVVQLLAPPPVTPTTSTPGSVMQNLASVDVVITGPVVNGSGFYDPGAGFPNHITASIPGGVTVNSVTYDSPTQVTLNLNTIGATTGLYAVTITNPDGQSATSSTDILEIEANLPVELSSFTSKTTKDGVELMWRTKTEVNNYGFDIERAQTNEQFEKIGFVEGNGNSNSPKEYSFTDVSANYGTYSYRLKQIDNDGQFEYSNVIEVNAGEIPDEITLEQNYPNPFNPSTIIRFALTDTQPAKLNIYDVLGNKLQTLFDGIAEEGKVYNFEFSTTGLGKDLSSGVYYYRLETENKIESKKMLLLK